jgi:hypothetical protein
MCRRSRPSSAFLSGGLASWPAMQTATEKRKGNYTSTPIYNYRYKTYMANRPPIYIYLALLLLRVKVAPEHRLVR